MSASMRSHVLMVCCVCHFTLGGRSLFQVAVHSQRKCPNMYRTYYCCSAVHFIFYVSADSRNNYHMILVRYNRRQTGGRRMVPSGIERSCINGATTVVHTTVLKLCTIAQQLRNSECRCFVAQHCSMMYGVHYYYYCCCTAQS